MASHDTPRFDVVQVTLAVGGSQFFALDAHSSSAFGKRGQVLTVTVGSLLAYCHDPEVVQAYARAWRVATDYAPKILPAKSGRGSGDHNPTGLVLRLSGTPVRQQVNGIPSGASPTGIAHVRVALDRLVVHAYDVEAVRDWAAGWAAAEADALRLWPAAEPAAPTPARRAARSRR